MNSISIVDYVSSQGVSPTHIIITTGDPNTFSELINLRMDGVQTIAPFAKIWQANAGDHAIMVEFAKDVFDVAKGLFAAWLYDHLVNKNADNKYKD